MSGPKYIVPLRWLATIFFLIAGAMHFIIPQFYQAMMPPFIPFQSFFIVLTGIAEMAGGVGMQIPAVRRRTGILLIVLLVAVFPANIYVAAAQPALPGITYSSASMWLRLLFQPLFIAWVWWVSIKNEKQ